jgi:hypothetical protein
MIDSQNTSWSASFNCPNVSGDSFSRSSLFILSEALDYCYFNPASLFLASSTSAIPASASFQSEEFFVVIFSYILPMKPSQRAITSYPPATGRS